MDLIALIYDINLYSRLQKRGDVFLSRRRGAGDKQGVQSSPSRGSGVLSQLPTPRQDV